MTSVSGPADVVAAEVAEQVALIGARVVVVGGQDPEGELTKTIRERIAPAALVEHEPGPIDDFAEATVRHVADASARETIGWFRELRFERSHDDAVDGTADVVAAIDRGEVGTLLIHDDPADPRRVWIGATPSDLSIETDPTKSRHARLVDAAICAMVVNGGRVHIVPSTGPSGPEDDAALVRRRHPSAEADTSVAR